MDFGHPLNCLTFNLQRASRNLVRSFEEAAKDSGVTAPQFTTLSLIGGFGELTVSQIAERMGTDRTTLTRNLAVMARKGWIVEAGAQDRRLSIWRLSPEGHATLDAALPVWRRFQAGLVDRIGPDAAAALLTTLTRL
ncbi:MAG: MarR family winged helix-turn-helix transcriptional regulator [Tabrizicola sp.]